MAPALITLAEAGQLLGVSRRRAQALVQGGLLPAERYGNQWLVPATAPAMLKHTRYQAPGRRLSQAGAWRLVEVAGHQAASDLDGFRRRARARAEHVDAYAHPSLIDEVTHNPDVVLGGRHAAAAGDAPVDEDTELDVYVRAGDATALMGQLHARRSLDGANIHFHLVADQAWPFPPIQQVAGLWVAWLDLADRQDRAADTVLDRLIGRRRA